MPRLTLQNLIRPTTTPEQLLFLDWFYIQFDFRTIGANRHIVNVEPLFFQGAIAGTEFLAYAATKLYICYDVMFVAADGNTAQFANVITYNEADAANGRFSNDDFEGHEQDAEYFPDDLRIQNLYFSRVAVQVYDYIKFIGYRITLD
jgi:hypothetical protein